MYPDTQLLINGTWVGGSDGRSIDVVNPADGKVIGKVASAEIADLEFATVAAKEGFAYWRNVSGFERCALMRRAAQILRDRAQNIAAIMTAEQGKPLGEAEMEINAAADVIDWFAEEARRSYGRIIPARKVGVQQEVLREPVGPVAAFTPWNFPVNQAVRKLAAALAAGCSIIVKGPEETPASTAAMIQAFVDAGIPAGVIGLVFGNPPEISEYLISHPVIRKISFTGSTTVGKALAASAGQYMKRATMELGGHAPAIVFADADLEKATQTLTAAKFRNGGQVCISPTRFLVEEAVKSDFVRGVVAAAEKLQVGNGAIVGTQMGPMANARRVDMLEALVSDATAKGAILHTGGNRIGSAGYFFAPTVLSDVPVTAAIMNEEPFGPVILVNGFSSYGEMVDEANRLPFGLAAYAFTRSAENIDSLARDIESGMMSINHYGLGLPETPFGGIKDSGYGSEGGTEAMEAYLVSKYVTKTAA
jgi:succinate-semialdehyde dehydrogenase/glutarate-semialdehyde dehydrogenase